MAMSRLGGSPDLKTQDKQPKYSIEFAGRGLNPFKATDRSGFKSPNRERPELEGSPFLKKHLSCYFADSERVLKAVTGAG
ncbi:hypothetical protein CO665_27230 [Rhizobium anhuiense]|nr:hypothetical protein CO665_27230 [Rhizobium anhuiense]